MYQSGRVSMPWRRCYSRVLESAKIGKCLETGDRERGGHAVASKVNIMNFTKQELKQEFNKLGIPEYRATQVFQWIYGKGVKEFATMVNIGKSLCKRLDELFEIKYGSISSDLISGDGTRKWLVSFDEKSRVESVFIPEVNRGTICVSSQVGCTMSCKFCHTGTQPLLRNLSVSEMVGQVMVAREHLFDFPNRDDRILTNVVFMGQGEPFYNYLHVSKAIRIMNDEEGLSISKRKITVSTCGVVPNIYKMGAEFPGINLAISLHATNDELRSELVPINKTWPISELIDACKKFPSLSHHRRILFEYILLKDVNDSAQDAMALVKLLKGFPSLVNIIPFNSWPGSKYESVTDDKAIEFSQMIEAHGISSPIRWPRGRDILAACGQLKTFADSKLKN